MITEDKILLNEEVAPYQVVDSIKKRYEVKINYKADDEPNGKGVRLIQPVAYGLSKAGNPVLRAFQPYGDTETKVPHWKMFRLDRVVSWKPLKSRKFTEPPHEQYGGSNVGDIYGKYNPNGDKSMSTVYVIADFEGAKSRYEKGGLQKYNAAMRKKREEENPYYGLKQNIKNSTMATPEIMKRIEDWQKEKQKRLAKKTSNNQSAKEMASIKNFGDHSEEQTVGPISKNGEVQTTNNTATTTQNQQNQSQTQRKNNYKNVNNNGPVQKNTTQNSEQDEYDTSENNNKDLNKEN